MHFILESLEWLIDPHTLKTTESMWVTFYLSGLAGLKEMEPDGKIQGDLRWRMLKKNASIIVLNQF